MVTLSSQEEALLEGVLNESTPETSSEAPQEKIPVNSEELETTLVNARYRGAPWFDKMSDCSVLVGGVGGIGSHLLFLLSRLNLRWITAYDPDMVEEANMSGQFYSFNDIGRFKTDALFFKLANYSKFYKFGGNSKKFTKDIPGSNIMMCGFDNMEARKDFFSAWKRFVTSHEVNPETCLFVDGRLNAENFQVLTIQGNDKKSMDKYEKEWLFDDSEVEPAPCSYKQTTFMASMIASVMANLLVNFVSNQTNPIFPRDLPFFIYYDASTMYFRVEN